MDRRKNWIDNLQTYRLVKLFYFFQLEVMMFKKESKVRNHKFRVGDIIRVRSKEEISENLNPMNKLNGCLFMNQMWEFCEKEFKIVKVVKNFFDEHQCKIYQVSAPLYILDGIICDGKIESFKHTCDHSCYLLWHEDWIMKASST